MIRRVLTTVATATIFLFAGGTAAFADDIGLCYANGGGGSSASGVSLASTGSGIDITTWAGVGIGLVLLGVYLMVFWPGRRRHSQPDTTSA